MSTSDVSDDDIHRLKKAFIILVILGVSLALMYINRTQSYYKYERIQFESNGATLYANLLYPTNNVSFQEKSPLLIYAHGIGYQRDLDLRIPIEFTKRGFFVAAIDYQGHGESGGNIDNVVAETGIPALAQDCSRLLDKLETLPFYEYINTSQLGLIGHSLGGFTVLMTQALDDRLNVTVAWAPLVDPVGSNIPVGQQYTDYHPVNLINENNTNNLLIISHVDDEALPHEKNAVIAQKLTGCELINISYPLAGGGHTLLTDEVIIESIKWFETNFFGSDSINGPIVITFIFNYILIFTALFALFMATLTMINYSSKYFNFIGRLEREGHPKKGAIISKMGIRFQWIKIAASIGVFVFIWLFFQHFFGLYGLFYASLFMMIVYAIGKLYVNHKKSKSLGRKFDLKTYIRDNFDSNALLFTLFATGYYIGLILLFTFAYPFAFIFPSNVYTIIAALTSFPLYFCLELLYRKVIYRELWYVKSEKQKAKIIAGLAIIIQIILISWTLSWSVIPVVIITHVIFLASVIYNTAIYAETRNFSSIVICSFITNVIFFGAIISQALGFGATLHYLVQF